MLPPYTLVNGFALSQVGTPGRIVQEVFMSKALSVCAFVVVMFFNLLASAQQITSFDVPGASGTTPTYISPDGIVVGTYLTGNVWYGFVRYPDGKLIELQPPNTGANAFGIAANSAGQIVGGYEDSGFVYHGFLWDRSGQYTVLDLGTGSTYVSDMNWAGDITGSTDLTQGFLRKADGTVTFFTLGTEIFPESINASDQITGTFYAGTDPSPAFIRDSDGTVVYFQVGSGGTFADKINDAGTVAGFAYGKTDFARGYFRSANGKVVTFSPLGSVYNFVTGLNSAGTVVGFFDAASGGRHGFVRPVHGPTIVFDVPGASLTTILNINQSGVIVGQYEDSLGTHGFIAKK